MNRNNTSHGLCLNNNVTTLISLILLVLLLYDQKLLLSDRQSPRVPTPELCAREEKNLDHTLALSLTGNHVLFSSKQSEWGAFQLVTIAYGAGINALFFFYQAWQMKEVVLTSKRFPVKGKGARSDTIHPR